MSFAPFAIKKNGDVQKMMFLKQEMEKLLNSVEEKSNCYFYRNQLEKKSKTKKVRV